MRLDLPLLFPFPPVMLSPKWWFHVLTDLEDFLFSP